MGKYVDGYLIPVPKKNLERYKRMARKAGKIWMEHGALRYVETVAEDVKPGKVTSFPRAVIRKRGETVVMAYVEFRSRSHRDRVNKKAMSDPRLAGWAEQTMPFDGKRMIWGGFTAFVSLQAPDP